MIARGCQRCQHPDSVVRVSLFTWRTTHPMRSCGWKHVCLICGWYAARYRRRRRTQ